MGKQHDPYHPVLPYWRFKNINSYQWCIPHTSLSCSLHRLEFFIRSLYLCLVFGPLQLLHSSCSPTSCWRVRRLFFFFFFSHGSCPELAVRTSSAVSRSVALWDWWRDCFPWWWPAQPTPDLWFRTGWVSGVYQHYTGRPLVPRSGPHPRSSMVEPPVLLVDAGSTPAEWFLISPNKKAR